MGGFEARKINIYVGQISPLWLHWLEMVENGLFSTKKCSVGQKNGVYPKL
jgi:hypothetical protein